MSQEHVETKYPPLKTLSTNAWDESFHSLILDIENLKGSLNCPALGSETIEGIREWVRIENAIRSNRIEGNQTTYAQMEAGLKGDFPQEEMARYKVIENTNHYNAETDIDKTFEESGKSKIPLITETLVRQAHHTLMNGIPLKAEGVLNPGEYRTKQVAITGSKHSPPIHLDVPPLMTELAAFSSNFTRTSALVDTAIAHHRFAWIHPFENGNGRTARLFTYAMLKDRGFHFNGMLSLPRAFERDKSKYYAKLAAADGGDVTAWVLYFLQTLFEELKYWETRLVGNQLEKKIDMFLSTLRQNKLIKPTEQKVLRYAFLFGTVTNRSVQKVLGLSPVTASRTLTKLKEKNYLEHLGLKKGYRVKISISSPLIEYFLPA